jgi:hypothetical protein
MPLLYEAIAKYHELLDSRSYRDLGWAECMQEEMRRKHLVESGRIISPVLRPEFISRPQLEQLSGVAERLTTILDKVEEWAAESPQLLRRIQMVPAEKMLVALSCGYPRSSIATRMDAGLQNGTLSMRGVESCKPIGLAYGDLLADVFLAQPIMQDFRRGGYRASKLGKKGSLLATIQRAWKQFGGTRAPQVAIVEFGRVPGNSASEGELLAEILRASGAPARRVQPEELQFRDNKLRVGDFEIDVVFRRFLTRELLARFDLSHPLLRAYEAGAVCVVNGFRSEMARRRAIFELLTDEAVLVKLSAADQTLVRSYIPWTRFVSARKTRYKEEEVDLLPFIRRGRQRFVLRPNEDTSEDPVFVGARLSQATWDGAVQAALRSPYVVQEHQTLPPQTFPLLQYGEVQLKQVTVSMHPNVYDGELQGASASLEFWSNGFARPVALAPVLVIDRS